MIEYRRDDPRRLNIVRICGRFTQADVDFLKSLMSDPDFPPDYDRLVEFAGGADRNIEIGPEELVSLAVAVSGDLARRDLPRPVQAALVMGEAADHPLLSSWPLFQAERDPVIVQTLCEDVDEALRHLGRPEGLDPGAARLIKTNAA